MKVDEEPSELLFQYECDNYPHVVTPGFINRQRRLGEDARLKITRREITRPLEQNY